jgi:cytochrome oxidase assembly protein ShyY1
VYRFLATPRWLGLAGLTLVLAAAMVALGFWQLDRYHERSAFNARVDAAAKAAPTPLTQLLRPGQPPPEAMAWTRVAATGRFDPTHEVLARARTLDGRVGFEVLTPLVLADGSAVLVNRGWLPAPAGDATAQPSVPPAPQGLVDVVGRVHLPESRPDAPVNRDGHVEVRRIAPAKLAPILPYPLYDAYVYLDSPFDQRLRPLPPEHQNALQNGGYVVQWWMFAAMTLVGYGYLARREAVLGAGTGVQQLERLANRATPVAPSD